MSRSKLSQNWRVGLIYQDRLLGPLKRVAEMVSDLLDWGEIVLRTGSYGQVIFGFASINSHWSTNGEGPTPRAKEEKAAKNVDPISAVHRG